MLWGLSSPVGVLPCGSYGLDVDVDVGVLPCGSYGLEKNSKL